MTRFATAVLALALGICTAYAQATPAAPAAGAPAAAQPAPASPMTAKGSDKQARSKQCSTEADQKGLHGKARKSFRSKCKAGKA